MVIISWSIPNCEFTTEDVTKAFAICLLSNQCLAHQTTQATHAAPMPAPALRGPKLERPKIDVSVSTKEWNVFVHCWEVFHSGSSIDTGSAPHHLFQCASPALRDSLLKANRNITSQSLQDLLSAMQSLAVIPVATCVLHTKQLQMHQERDEMFRSCTA